MITITIKRLSAKTDPWMFGVLLNENRVPMFTTLERPWKDNAENISCVPAGSYQFRRVFSPKHGLEVFQALNIPGRTLVEIHPGNFITDTLGCILIGTSFSSQQGHEGIMDSKIAFNLFMQRLSGVDRIIVIIEEA